MLYRIAVAERGLTGIANIFRSRLSRLDDLLRAGTVPLKVLFTKQQTGLYCLCRVIFLCELPALKSYLELLACCGLGDSVATSVGHFPGWFPNVTVTVPARRTERNGTVRRLHGSSRNDRSSVLLCLFP